MCARYQVAEGLLDFLELFGIGPQDLPEMPVTPRDCRPTDPVAAILANPDTGRIELQYPRWGLVPRWADDPRIGTRMFNARAETVAEKPAYRDAFRKRRCILPVGMFYEFDDTSRYRILMANRSVMAVAGIWECKKSDQEPPLLTCSMITTEANELIAPVHDRMPAILMPEHYMPWLDRQADDPQQLLSFLRPYKPEGMVMEFDGAKKSARTKAPLPHPGSGPV